MTNWYNFNGSTNLEKWVGPENSKGQIMKIL